MTNLLPLKLFITSKERKELLRNLKNVSNAFILTQASGHKNSKKSTSLLINFGLTYCKSNPFFCYHVLNKLKVQIYVKSLFKLLGQMFEVV